MVTVPMMVTVLTMVSCWPADTVRYSTIFVESSETMGVLFVTWKLAGKKDCFLKLIVIATILLLLLLLILILY